MMATADAPTRNNSGSGFSISMRTGNRCAMCTQFNSRGTAGTPCEIDISQGVPAVPRELNWVHIAQRFPVRIEIENPDPELFRVGASAVAIIKSAPVSH